VNYRVRRHEKVEDDILDLAAWIGRDSRPMAFSFLEAVESTLSDLRSMPNKGSPKNLRPLALRNVRSWAVRGFPNHLILYDVRTDHIFIYAIVHASKRYARLLRERS